METNNHFPSTGQPPLSSSSGLKPLPQLVEPVYTNNSLVLFPQQVKSLNCDMPVNGLISPSLPANTHGTFASGTSTASHPTSNTFDYLWKFPKSPILKDCHGPSLPKVNGSTSPVSHGPFYKGNSQDTWENATSSCLASLSFIGQDLCNFSNINVKVASAANGTHCTPKAPQPASASILHVQADSPASLCQDELQAMEEDGAETLEDEEESAEEAISPDVQPDQTSSEPDEEDGPSLAVDPEPVSETMPLPSASDVGQLDDSSPLPTMLGDSEDLRSESLRPCENEPGHELPVQPASSASYHSKEQEEETQENESSVAEALDMESSPSIANDPPVIEEEESSDLVIAESDSPELGDCVMQDTSEMEENPESPQQNKSEEPQSALESVLSEEINVEDTMEELIVASPPRKKARTRGKLKVKRGRLGSQCKQAPPPADEFEHVEVKGTPGRRRIATPEEVRQPMLNGWKREVRIRKGHHRWQGETWYYAPCGKRMKQFPEVIKYLSKNADPRVRREHFSFSPRMPVGDFYEERQTANGPQWVLLNSEEIPSRILAITGKRGRPRNLEKAKAKENKVKRGRGRPPKVKMIDLLNKADAKLLRKLENQDILSDVEKVQLSKLRKKMRRKARNQEAKQEAAKKLKLREKREREKEEKKREEEQKIREAELLAEKKAKEAEQIAQKRKTRRRQRQKAPAPAPPPVVHKPDRKQLAQQRRLEERKRQQFMLEELKKPTEDMCLPDHQPLPDFPSVPGLVLPSCAFSDCLMTVEFLYAYGKVFGLNDAKDVPNLHTLQEGLFNVGDSLGEVQDLLVKLLRAALFDPGLPAYCQSLKILGEKVSEIGLTRENVSEALRIFLEAYGGDIELCESLRTHPFQAHPPHIKAAILAFIVNELNASTRIISEIDKTLECMSNYRKNKWIIEGKLRRLKFALSKKAGAAQECQMSSPEESAKKQGTFGTEEEEDLAEDKPGVLLKNSADEGEEVSLNASTQDLERQMEKLTKRQTFLRKKIIACSQRLRSVSLGQDRYRRFYWMLPHVGGIFVEGYSESPGETPDPPPAELPEVACVKSEPVDGSEDKCYITFTRSRGRPRKSKTDLEQYKFCQCRESQEVPINGLLPTNTPGSEQQQDLGQTNVLSWLTHCKNAILNSTVLTPENSPRSDTASAFEIGPCPGAIDTDEKENKLYNLLPRTRCTDPPQKHSPQPNHLLHSPAPATATPAQTSGLTVEQHTGADTPLPSVSVLCHICNKPIRNGMAGLHSSAQERRRGRPSRKRFSAIEQRYYSQLIQRPIPDDKKQAWWWIKDPTMLEALIKALHTRGIREKSLHKHLTKHLSHLKEMCSKAASDPIFEFKPAEGHPVNQETLDKWSVEQWSFQVDLQVLRWVEDLEQRVLVSDLQIRGWFPPSSGSVRTDLKYFEHTVDVSDDILAKVKREDVQLHREPDNPLDIAVLRLIDMEQNVERRYLKEPLWILSEVQNEKIVTTDPETMNTTEIQYSITPRMRLWRQTVERCRSAAQLTLCLQQLEKCLAWERSVSIVTCIYCRKGDNDEYLLLCDSCDRGCHTYCHRPPMAEIPEGDWFCRNCVSQQCEHEYLKPGGSSRRIKKSVQRYQDDSPIKPPRRKEPSTTLQQSPAENSVAKKRRIGTRSQSPDLTFCEIILMEMESHDDAWPFLEPVNPRLVPGYRKIIKNPMDFSTMRNKLLNGRYSSCEEFAEDAELVFSNCQLFNEDESEVGKAGLVLKKFYESRWEEFSQERLNNSL